MKITSNDIRKIIQEEIQQELELKDGNNFARERRANSAKIAVRNGTFHTPSTGANPTEDLYNKFRGIVEKAKALVENSSDPDLLRRCAKYFLIAGNEMSFQADDMSGELPEEEDF